MQSGDPDARLMLAYRAGDESALADLYGRWATPLVRFLERMVRERAVAEELMQETFVRVHGARDRYAPDARFSTWLFRIARNLALNELERMRNRAPHLSTDADERESARRPGLALVAPGPSALSIVEARRDHERLEAWLAELPERQRSALWLAAVEGHSYEEIAGILDTTSASVKALVHRARVGLADRMATAATGPLSAEEREGKEGKDRKQGKEAKR